MNNLLQLFSISYLKNLYIKEAKQYLIALDNKETGNDLERRRIKLMELSTEIDLKIKGKSTTILFY